ncbi:MAG: four helix bundle protein [Prevotella sp.]|nr:four helix bundle protein [Prevotella sp.]
MKENNLIREKSFNFAVRCVNLRKYLMEIKHETVLSKQLLRSGTSIGANVKEALRGQSKADFGAKMNISLKEASEAEYWLDLLFATNYISKQQYESMQTDCVEIIKLLTSIVKTTFENK